jgi:hypothetical protein
MKYILSLILLASCSLPSGHTYRVKARDISTGVVEIEYGVDSLIEIGDTIWISSGDRAIVISRSWK